MISPSRHECEDDENGSDGIEESDSEDSELHEEDLELDGSEEDKSGSEDSAVIWKAQSPSFPQSYRVA
jgi:hypothetical protein